MKAVVQRVSKASVTIEKKIVSQINNGLLILVGIEPEDNETDIEWLSKKITNLRIFNDENDVMNHSLIDVCGDAIIVSQFTLQASTKKGNRPSYINAAKPEIAIPLYKQFIKNFETQISKKVGSGEFGADMKVELLNDGPVTILLDSKNRT